MTARLAALLVLLPLAASWAQGALRPVAVEGQVEHPAAYSLEALAALPTFEVRAPKEAGGDAAYVGPMLWPMLEAARPIDGPARGAHLQHVVFARGADGYAVALAIGEIDPRFEGKPVIVAFKQDGKLLAAPRLVIPGDHRPGRLVRDLVALDIR